MSTSASLNVSSLSPTTSPTISPTDQLTAIMIALSCLVLFVLIVLLGSLIYRKDPFCCKSRAYQDSHADLEPSSQHYSSRQTLVGSPCTDLPQNFESLDNINPQSGQLFYVGVPSTYCLPPMDPSLPHLPSYESVRKKDRQRQIHMMIADRFGLNGPVTAEAPPTYEESVRQSLQSLQTLDAPYDTIPPSVMPQVVLSQPMNALPQYEELRHTATSPDSNNDPHPMDSD
ncbi:hypothetical protein PHYPO_G00045310 [Pangasianodon hypophthalmus]|uniref:Uncharacterized protein n=1 Tax=Pangasianodon hypophthalmus TaxID=310915 RepID=A0A5N5MI10_PANHP|nr:uncharacterized protein si:ch73-364h19.1 [Pangasianodon hypophthalmus]KAB5554021.1 hypothetical protein PHYPO_G00045310 [Pangasianodon hypophthalmus]